MTEKAFPELEDLLDETEARDLAEAMPLAIAGDSPPPALRDRLVKTVATAPERFAPFASRMAAMVDLGVERARELLSSVLDDKSWEAGPLPGVSLIHFDGGARVAHADCGFVRVPAGTHFPRHRHLGTERVLLIFGSYRDSDGNVYAAGDVHEKLAGTEHSYVVAPDSDLVLLLVLEQGIEMISE